MNPLKPLKKVRNAYYERKYQTTSAILKALERNSIVSPKEWKNDAVTMQLVGHSTFLINMYWKWILTDPVFSKRVGFHFFWKKFGSTRRTCPTLTIEDIPQVDYILLSHAHLDHRDTDSLKRLAKHFPDQITVICPKNTRGLLRKVHHLKASIELDRMDSIQLDNLSVDARETKHRGMRYFITKIGPAHKRGNKRTKWYNSYVIWHKDTHLFFAGDTTYTTAFKKINKKIDVAMMPIGWRRFHHCSPEEAREMAWEHLKAKWFLPMHFETFHSSKQPIYRLYEESKRQHAQIDMQLGISSLGEMFFL